MIGKKISLGKTFLLILLVTAIYRITLDFIYTYMIAPLWEYQHFDFEYNVTKYYLSWIWIVAISYQDWRLLPDNRPSAILLLFLDYLFYIPLSSLISLANLNESFFIYSVAFWIISMVIYFKTNRPDSKLFEQDTVKPTSIFLIVTIAITLFNFLVTVYYNGFKIKIDLNDVYDIRLAAREVHMFTLANYIKPLATPVIMILFMITIIKKRFVLSFVLIIIQLVNFAFGATKGDFFVLFLVIICGFFYKLKFKNIILLGFVLLNVVAIIEYKITGISATSMIFQRRLLYVPPLLSSEFFEFFNSNPILYFRDSFLRHFIENPYGQEIPRVIGEYYYGNPEMNANTGILGNDFAELGWFSLIIFPYLRILVLRFFDYCSRGVHYKIILFLAFEYAIAFAGGAFFTILLTCGFIAICLILFLMNNQRLSNILMVFKRKTI